MTPSWRKPVGMLLILLILALWCAAAVTLVDALSLPVWAQGLLYLFAGIAWLWVFPMRRMLRWMELGLWRD
jgi:hypothetical protein